jgi:hypothetical protein
MGTVALIPTGALEHAALAESLGRLFPTHTFLVRPPERHLNGFTSRDVAPLVGAPSGPVPTELEELVAELVNAIFPGRRGEPGIDLAFVVEDLELVNDHQTAQPGPVYTVDAPFWWLPRGTPRRISTTFATRRWRTGGRVGKRPGALISALVANGERDFVVAHPAAWYDCLRAPGHRPEAVLSPSPGRGRACGRWPRQVSFSLTLPS